MQEVIIVAIVFGSILAMIKLVLDHVSSRRSSSADRSMTAGELEHMIEEAVQQSTRELRRRIENLEAIATDETSARGSLLLDEPDESDEISLPEREKARRMRS